MSRDSQTLAGTVSLLGSMKVDFKQVIRSSPADCDICLQERTVEFTYCKHQTSSLYALNMYVTHHSLIQGFKSSHQCDLWRGELPGGGCKGNIFSFSSGTQVP